ncbi:hypothetical protein DP176_08155 [Polynucleobacter paneuropaeus]|uniref:Uncharacterized protein n=1 Tax=Polynucleobacter paneuropaeus TaxID=2527775 RepID=A0ABX9FBS7_9BURK|nr:hypothetical protein [Polynucleobacter paneuropaeus]QWD19418.1 hypothetical protein G6696_07630 [Polynucleobacter paneuropaeus]RAZ41236.1 hypothetical protein DP176_08155 [Polynucleobacter paneuropaeus]
MKKIYFIVAASLIATSAMAQSAFEGFYAQAGIGYENDSLNSNSLGFPASTGLGTISASSYSGS